MLLIYINGLSLGSHTDVNLISSNKSLFPVVDNFDESVSKLNNDLIRIQDWAHKWKMNFKSEKPKPAYEFIFCLKTKNITYPNLLFISHQIVKTASQKHLEPNLNARFTFNDNIKEKIRRAIKGAALVRSLRFIFTTFQSACYLQNT